MNRKRINGKTMNQTGSFRPYRCMCLTACLALAMTGTALAEEDREPVEEIRLVFHSEIETGGSSSEVEVTTEDDSYSVGGAEAVNAAGDWEGGVRPKVEVILYAEDGYYFPRVREDMFVLTGEDVEYVSARRQEDNTELVLTVRLEELEAENLWVDGLGWDKEQGLARWEENPSARGYEVRLYRGSTLVDSTVFRSSSDTTWSVSGKMREGGTYYFQVRAMGTGSSRGEWETSGKWTPSGSGSQDHETTSDSDKEMVSPSGSSKPQEGYYSDEEFDPDRDYGDHDRNDRGNDGDQDQDHGPGAGFGQNSTWDRPGATAITTYPDPVTTGGDNRWQQDQQGWWLHLKDNTWPVNAWVLVDGQWYCFDQGGYVRHGWILSGDKWYYCQENGAMLVNARTPDGHFVGGDGVWIQ